MIRTVQLDGVYKRRPLTTHYCIRCQKDLAPGKPYRWVHLIAGGGVILHRDDETSYTPDAGDVGLHPIGPDCARKVGLEFTHPMETMKL